MYDELTNIPTGTKLYKHNIKFGDDLMLFPLIIISFEKNPATGTTYYSDTLNAVILKRIYMSYNGFDVIQIGSQGPTVCSIYKMQNGELSNQTFAVSNITDTVEEL